VFSLHLHFSLHLRTYSPYFIFHFSHSFETISATHPAVAISFLIFLYSTSSIHASDVCTLNCDPLSIQRAEPIMSPGVAFGHVHAIVGGTAFNRTMSGNDSAVDASATTCDKFTDNSNYVLGSWYFTLDYLLT
jgi:hypothetical protein